MLFQVLTFIKPSFIDCLPKSIYVIYKPTETPKSLLQEPRLLKNWHWTLFNPSLLAKYNYEKGYTPFMIPTMRECFYF